MYPNTDAFSNRKEGFDVVLNPSPDEKNAGKVIAKAIGDTSSSQNSGISQPSITTTSAPIFDYINRLSGSTYTSTTTAPIITDTPVTNYTSYTPITTYPATTFPATTFPATTFPGTTIGSIGAGQRMAVVGTTIGSAATTLPATTFPATRPSIIPKPDIPPIESGFYKQNNATFKASNINDYYNKIVNGNISFSLNANNVTIIPYVMYYFYSSTTYSRPGSINYTDKNNIQSTFQIDSNNCDNCSDLNQVYCYKIYIDTNYNCSVTKTKILEITPILPDTTIATVPTMILYYPFNVDILNYATGTGVVDGSIVGTSVSIDNSLYITGSGSLKQSRPVSTDSYFKIPTIPANTQGYTFAFWLNFKTDFWSVNVFNFDNDKIKMLTLNGTIYLIFDGVSLGIGDNFKNADYLNKWNHYTWTIDKTGNTVLYFNGIPFFKSGGYTYFSEIMNNNFILGGGYSIQGNVDDFRYYDGILTQDKITDIFNIRNPI
jgi:hypothetical protein